MSSRRLWDLGSAWFQVTWPFLVGVTVIGGGVVVQATHESRCDERATGSVERLRAVGDPLFQGEAVRVRPSTGCLVGGASEAPYVGYEMRRISPPEFVQRVLALGWTHLPHTRHVESADGAVVASLSRVGYPNGTRHFWVYLEHEGSSPR